MMKSRFGKIALLGFIVLLTTLCLCFTAMAETHSGTCGDNLTWSLDDEGLLTISGTGKMRDYESDSSNPWGSGVKLVDIKNGVTSIGSWTFCNSTGLTSISIPNSVTSIGESAFFHCTSLKSITIPNSVTSIGAFAFQECTGLTSITISNSVTSIKRNTFDSCTGLTSITIPGSVTSIEEFAFSLTGLTSITIPNSVTSIGVWAFSECHDLRKVICNAQTNQIDFPLSFAGCPSLIEITIPEDHSAYCSQDGVVFSKDKSSLLCFPEGKKGTYNIPNNVTSIGVGAFDGCTGLKSITIPNSVTSIGWSAFIGCTGLTSITIPNSVTSIGVGAFDGCTGLKSITIPNSVTSIDYGVFNGCTGLTSITIPNSVTSIGVDAFSGCTGLTSIKLSEHIQSIDSDAFPKSTKLIVFEGSYAAQWAQDNGYEYEIIQPERMITLTSDGNGTASANPASGVKGTEVTLTAQANDGYTFKAWKVVSGDVTITDNKFTIGNSDIKIQAIFEAIPSITLTSDGNGTASANPASGAKGTEVTLTAKPNEGYRFKAWKVISGGVTITDNKFIIGTEDVKIRATFELAEYSVTVTSDSNGSASADPVSGVMGTPVKLTASPKSGYRLKEWKVLAGNITVTNNQFTIGTADVRIQAVFELIVSGEAKLALDPAKKTATFIGPKDKSVKTVTIPATYKQDGVTYKITAIEPKAFKGCTKLTSVTIGKNVKTIGKYAFSGCKALKKVTGCAAVTKIGDNAFASCAKLTTLPAFKKLKTIGVNAFKGCKILKAFTLSSSVTKIGKNAFNGCAKLSSIVIKTKKLTEKSVGAGAFKGINKKAKFTCPKGKQAVYEKILLKKGATKTMTIK